MGEAPAHWAATAGEAAAAGVAAPGVADDALPNFTHAQIVRVLTGILLCILLAAVDQTVVIPAVPAIAAELNGFAHLSWIVSAYLVTSTALTPIYGKLSDIYGRRAMLLPAIVLFMVASVFCGLAQSLPQLIVARALQGVGGAGLMSMAQAAIADVVAPRERGRYQAYMAGTWAVASVAGPLVGGFVTDHLSWRWIFLVNVPIGAVAYVLSSRALKLLRVRRRATRIDYAGAVLLTGFITAALLVMSWGGNEYAWASWPILAAAIASLAFLAALVAQERRVADPLLPPRLFANGVFSRGVAIAFLAASGLLSGTFLLPLFFQLVRGADASTSGTMLVPFLVFNTVGAYASGQLARRLGRAKAIVVGGLAATVAGFALLTLVGPETSFALLVAAMAIVGAGIGMCMPACLVIVQNAAERRDLGSATGALLFLRSMGGAFGSTLVGALLTSRFASGLAAAGVTQAVDLGAMRQGGGSAAGLSSAARTAAEAGLLGGFRLAFAVCAGLAVLALLVSVGMRDLLLQSSGERAGTIGH